MSMLVERDARHVWHPFTQAAYEMHPLPVRSATGALLVLEDGREIIDGISSWWCCLHGHAHPEICRAIAMQAEALDHVLFAGCTHEPAVSLAENVLALLPSGFSRVFYSDNGSTAVEVALKMAVQSWKNRGESRIRILSLEHGYHGDTFGAMAVGARGLFSLAFEELMFDVEHLGTEGLDDDVARCETLCAQGDVAAFIFEPRVQGAEGMRMYPLTVLDRYMEICRRHGVVCIADEVMTGFGRAGPLFVSSDLRVTPDIVCLSKGLTSGTLPLAMTLCGEKLFESFRSHDFGKTFFHGHTFTANPIACAAALASVRLAAGGECTERRDRIARAHSRCGRELERYAGISNVRQAGTILAFDVRVDETSGYASTVREETNEFFLERGILLRPLGNVVYFLPPYCITEQELGRVHDALLEFAAARSR